MQDRITEIVAFVRAVEAKSFTRAGERLGVSRSAVGKSIARLERHLGTRLLHRTTRSLSLSQEGTLFYERCSRILQDLEEAELAASSHGEEPFGTLRLDLPVSFGRLHVMPLITSFLRRWPEISIQASFTDHFTDLVAEGIDLAIRIGGEGDNRLVGRTLASNRMVICASPDYVATHGAPVTPDDLRAHQCIGFMSGGRPLDWRFQADGRSWTQAVHGRLRLNSTETILEATLDGTGLAQLDQFVAGSALKSGRLIPVLDRFAAEGAAVRAVYPSRRYLSPKVRLFIDAAVAAWKRPPWEL